MARQNGAEQFVDILVRAGVERLYGLVGDSLDPVVDAVRRNAAIDWVHVRHEETAAFAAGAEAQITGKLTECAGSWGPGNLHLINCRGTAGSRWASLVRRRTRTPTSRRSPVPAVPTEYGSRSPRTWPAPSRTPSGTRARPSSTSSPTRVPCPSRRRSAPRW
ncbi:MAG: hypothetical protein HOY76_37240 [Streptomyces sp.]|nr:hypothetical protein [Streptomyces sp.]